MANFFEGVWEALKHPIDEAEFLVKGARDVIKGDRSIGDLFGDHQEMMNEITVPILGDNKIATNSDAIAGTIVGGILAAPAIMGAAGTQAGGTLGGAAASAGAPVTEAVGMSAADAIIAGGGSASEVGSVAAVDWGDMARRGIRGLSNASKQAQSQQARQQTSFGGTGAN